MDGTRQYSFVNNSAQNETYTPHSTSDPIRRTFLKTAVTVSDTIFVATKEEFTTTIIMDYKFFNGNTNVATRLGFIYLTVTAMVREFKSVISTWADSPSLAKYTGAVNSAMASKTLKYDGYFVCHAWCVIIPVQNPLVCI